MTKIALLIGVSEYGSDLSPLPGAVREVEALQQVLQPSEMSGFDEVKLLSNPNPPVMREALETLFSGRTNTDVVLLFFSGHIVRDDNAQLYFATSITRKSPRPELVRLTAIPVSFVRDLMSNSPCQHQVVILDYCFSSVSDREMTENDDNTADIKTQLSGERRSLLASFTSTENFFDPEGFDHSVYTRYLVEGIRTGAADLDSDGWISVDELHEYASNKVQVAAPGIKPEFYPVEGGDKIQLLLVPTDNPKLKYRKQVETWVNRGEISEAGRYILNKLAETLPLTSVDCIAIETEVLKPYQEYQKKLQQYKREFAKAIANNYPLDTQEREKLRGFQQSLGLRDEDVAPIEEQVALKLARLSRSEDEADEGVQTNSPAKAQYIPEPQYIPMPVEPLMNTTAASEDNANEQHIKNQPNSLPSTPSLVLPDSKPRATLQSKTSTPAVNSSSSLAGSQTSPRSVSTFPNKFLLLAGIGGAVATVALAIGISTRKPTAPAPVAVNSVNSVNIATPTNPKPDATPSPSPSPESKFCSVFVNGNLRSEPAPFRDNVVESLKEPLVVTGKQTKGGWVEVKLPSNKLGWAHQDIIASKDKTEMDACLSRKGIRIRTIEDIPLPPPPASSFPQRSAKE